jgi:hypothetical protein
MWLLPVAAECAMQEPVNASSLPSRWAEWLSLDHLEHQFGSRLLTEWLRESSLSYAKPPRLAGDGEVVARMTGDVHRNVFFLERRARGRGHEPRLALNREGLALTCTCEGTPPRRPSRNGRRVRRA